LQARGARTARLLPVERSATRPADRPKEQSRQTDEG